MDRIRDAARAGQIDVVIVSEQDRLSRNYAHTLLLMEEFEQHHVKLLFVRGSPEDTPEGKMLFGMNGLFKEYERAKIIERTRRGREARVKSGTPLMGGIPPYGYRWVRADQTTGGPGHLVVEPGEAAIVRLIFHWLVEEGCTLNEITRRLFKQGVNSKRGNPWWTSSTICQMLRNELYAGVAHYNKTAHVAPKRPSKSSRKTIKSSEVARPKEEWIPAPAPAIVSREIWEAAQQVIERNKYFSNRGARREYFLSGFIYCPKCGCRMIGKTVGKRQHPYTYYRCRKVSSPGKALCQNTTIRASLIDDAVWETVLRHLADPKRWRQDLERALERVEADTSRDDGLLTTLHEAELALHTKEDKLIELFEAGAITLDKFQERNPQIQQKLAAVQAERATIQEHLDDRSTTHTDLQELARLAKQVQAGLPACRTTAQKRRALELLQARVYPARKDGLPDGYAAMIEGVVSEILWQLPLPEQDQPTAEERAEGEGVAGFLLTSRSIMV